MMCGVWPSFSFARTLMAPPAPSSSATRILQTTACLMTYINTLLAEYESNREANAMRKDAAIALFIALAVKGQTAASGGSYTPHAWRLAPVSSSTHLLCDFARSMSSCSSLVEPARGFEHLPHCAHHPGTVGRECERAASGEGSGH
ncbi:MAG: hypothetical protein EOO65_01240 [Methanosarcinales archaeon]|nr:MAG: hypothetical protein EOO65_01240 [Methanosarcinales archaeon]